MAEFIRLLSERGVRATEVWHQELTLVTTMVDCWVEESTRLHGIDLYDRGGNIGRAPREDRALRRGRMMSTMPCDCAKTWTACPACGLGDVWRCAHTPESAVCPTCAAAEDAGQ
jgi:hypothetical protein